MSISISKKFLTYLVGASLVLAFMVPALLIAPNASAQTMCGPGCVFNPNDGCCCGEIGEEETVADDPACGTSSGGTITAKDILDPDKFDPGLGTRDLQSTIGSIIRAALGFLGVIAVCIILFGGFKWMTAGGQEDKVGDAKKLMIAGVIGLVIILSAYAIASYVIEQLVTATT